MPVFRGMNLFQRIRLFFARLFGQLEVPDQKAFERAIRVVDSLKTAASVAEIIAAATPNKIDDVAVGRVKAFLTEVADGLREVHRFVPTEKIGRDAVRERIQKYMDNLPDWERRGYYHALATKLAIALQDGKLSWHEAATLTQLTYDKLREKQSQ
jgi:hypothetical protein